MRAIEQLVGSSDFFVDQVPALVPFHELRRPAKRPDHRPAGKVSLR